MTEIPTKKFSVDTKSTFWSKGKKIKKIKACSEEFFFEEPSQAFPLQLRRSKSIKLKTQEMLRVCYSQRENVMCDIFTTLYLLAQNGNSAKKERLE